VSEVIGYAEACQSAELRQTRECGSGESSPDQYLFKKYFWRYGGVGASEKPPAVVSGSTALSGEKKFIALDYYQSIFGNTIEIEQHACVDGWKPRCAIEPCCTQSDRIEHFGHLGYTKFLVRECSVFRRNEILPPGAVGGAAAGGSQSGDPGGVASVNLPITWHGNGCGKWLFLIALDQLSTDQFPLACFDGGLSPPQSHATARSAVFFVLRRRPAVYRAEHRNFSSADAYARS